MKVRLVTTSVRVPQELLDKLQELADLNPKVNSRSDLIKDILFEYVEGR